MSYNGYQNYQTWAWFTWLNSDPDSQARAEAMAADSLATSQDKASAVHLVAQRLRDEGTAMVDALDLPGLKILCRVTGVRVRSPPQLLGENDISSILVDILAPKTHSPANSGKTSSSRF
jgi:hypothetical protein